MLKNETNKQDTHYPLFMQGLIYELLKKESEKPLIEIKKAQKNKFFEQNKNQHYAGEYSSDTDGQTPIKPNSNKMATSDKLHAFAFRTLKAMSYAENERRSEHEAVMNEAKLFNLSPNEIYCYIQNNRAALDNEIQEKKMQSSTA